MVNEKGRPPREKRPWEEDRGGEEPRVPPGAHRFDYQMKYLSFLLSLALYIAKSAAWSKASSFS